MKFKDDSERVFHRTQISDLHAKPLLGRLSGDEILILIASILISVIGFWGLSAKWGVTPLLALLITAAFPIGTYAFLDRFVCGKPDGFIKYWLHTQRLKSTKSPLLTRPPNHEE